MGGPQTGHSSGALVWLAEAIPGHVGGWPDEDWLLKSNLRRGRAVPEAHGRGGRAPQAWAGAIEGRSGALKAPVEGHPAKLIYLHLGRQGGPPQGGAFSAQSWCHKLLEEEEDLPIGEFGSPTAQSDDCLGGLLGSHDPFRACCGKRVAGDEPGEEEVPRQGCQADRISWCSAGWA